MRALIAALAICGLVMTAACTTAGVDLHEDGEVIGTGEATSGQAAVDAAVAIMKVACEERGAALAGMASDSNGTLQSQSTDWKTLLQAVELAESLLKTHKATIAGRCVVSGGGGR